MEIMHFRSRSHLLTKDKRPSGRQQARNMAVRILQIAENTSLGGTSLNTGWHHVNTDLPAFFDPLIYAVEAEGTFLHYTVRPVREWPWANHRTIRRQVRAIVWMFFLFLVVIVPDSIGTSSNTVFAADAPAEILHYNAILAQIGCLRWANLDTWGIVAVHARHWYHFDVQRRIFALTGSDHLVPVRCNPPYVFIG